MQNIEEYYNGRTIIIHIVWYHYTWKYDWHATFVESHRHNVATVYYGFTTGPPARTVGWRDPGFIHTGFLKDLWPNLK
jgi:hypothetical protein